MSSTAIGNYTTTSKFPLGLTSGTTTYTKILTVSWLGDVNLSHSPTPTNNLSVTGMTISNAPTMVDTRMFITNAGQLNFVLKVKLRMVRYIIELEEHMVEPLLVLFNYN